MRWPSGWEALRGRPRIKAHTASAESPIQEHLDN